MKKKMTAKVKLIKGSLQKEKWVTVGTAFVLESGQINLVLDTLPVKQDEWDGSTIALFPDTEEK